MKIAILITTHNRALVTFRFLESLYKCDIPLGVEIEVYLLDSNSEDNTVEIVEKNFTSVITLRGHSNLFWSSGMRKIWQHASQCYDYDFYLWANDDIVLFKNAIIDILRVSEIFENKNIVGGILLDNNNNVSYSGFNLKNNQIIENISVPTVCDLINGNFVLIPKYVFKKIGLIDDKYLHSFGDFDYSLMASKKNIKSYICNIPIGICIKNNNTTKWKDPSSTLNARIKNLYSPHSYANPIEFFHYNVKHFSLVRAVSFFFFQHIKLFFPQFF